MWPLRTPGAPIVGRTAARSCQIVDAFSRLVARRAADPLIVSPLQRVTTGEIDDLSRAVCARIVAASPAPGSLVGLSAPNGPAFLAGFLALRRAGLVPVLLDPQAPEADRCRAATALGAPSVLACASAWPRADAEFELSKTGAPAGAPLPRDIAVVKLTSGSTGVPRGVALRDEQLLADEAALASTMGLVSADRLLAALPLSHSYGFTSLGLSALVRGLPLVLPADHGPFSPLDAARALDATVFPTVPAYIRALLKVSQPPAWPPTLRLVMSAGAVLPGATAAQFRETYHRPVHVFYGSSECGGICYDRAGEAAERGTVGTPVDGVRVSLTAIDDDGPGTGLVTVESAAVGVTYLPHADPRLAAGRFETSDVAGWTNGELGLRRRVDHVINLRGRKVDPSEVEHVLAALDGVDEAVVIGVRSPGGDGEIVRAVVACATGRLSYQGVSAWCKHRLAEHKVPRSVILVDAIPRTSRGKIDRAALLRLGATGDADTASG